MTALVCAALMLWPFGPRKNEPPPKNLADEAYFYCPKCKSLWCYYRPDTMAMKLQIWNRHFDGSECRSCVHNWEIIKRAEFKCRADQQYGVTWPNGVRLRSERSPLKAADVKDLSASLEGAWAVVRAEKMGSELQFEGCLTIRNGEFELRQGDRVIESGEVRLRYYRSKLDEFDVVHCAGPFRELAGIFKLEGDTLRICFGRFRPEEFRTFQYCQPWNIEHLSDQIYMELKRQP